MRSEADCVERLAASRQNAENEESDGSAQGLPRAAFIYHAADHTLLSDSLIPFDGYLDGGSAWRRVLWEQDTAPDGRSFCAPFSVSEVQDELLEIAVIRVDLFKPRPDISRRQFSYVLNGEYEVHIETVTFDRGMHNTSLYEAHPSALLLSQDGVRFVSRVGGSGGGGISDFSLPDRLRTRLGSELGVLSGLFGSLQGASDRT